jgi:hypothetical protein
MKSLSVSSRVQFKRRGFQIKLSSDLGLPQRIDMV